jgi:hypothetical protein
MSIISAPDSKGSPSPIVAVTVREAADMHLRWLESRGRKARTIEGYDEMVGAHIELFFSDREL